MIVSGGGSLSIKRLQLGGDGRMQDQLALEVHYRFEGVEGGLRMPGRTQAEQRMEEILPGRGEALEVGVIGRVTPAWTGVSQPSAVAIRIAPMRRRSLVEPGPGHWYVARLRFTLKLGL